MPTYEQGLTTVAANNQAQDKFKLALPHKWMEDHSVLTC